VVPQKEGKMAVVNRINDIWRGEGYEKKLHLLDNDFFGQAEWEQRCDEILEGDFKICLNQGINVRLIHKEGAEKLVKMKYYDDQFKTKRIYTAWDNRKDENIFTKGMDIMLSAGIKPQHMMVYMLCGYWKWETWEDIFHRFNTMVKMGLMPYPMIYGEAKNYKELKKFQTWAIRRYYQFIPWEQYNAETKNSFYSRKYSETTEGLFDDQTEPIQ
jgi:hypothetical protein